jgi:hypothetical protein
VSSGHPDGWICISYLHIAPFLWLIAVPNSTELRLGRYAVDVVAAWRPRLNRQYLVFSG